MAITLKGTARLAGENVTDMRAGGEIPAVVYGAGRDTISIKVPLVDFIKVSKEAGESGTVTLAIGADVVTVLIHDIGVDPIRSIPIHADFLAIDVTKPIEVPIQLEFVGVSPAVKGSLGTLVKVLHEIEVRGLAKDLPHMIEVDISSLDVLDSHITVGDLKLPAGVTVLADAEDMVASIAAVKEEVEEAPTAIDFDSISVEKKGKKEEEGEPEAK